MKLPHVLLFLALAIVLFVGGFFITRRSGPAPEAQAPIGRTDAGSPRDATYEIEGELVTLADGVAQSAAAPGSAEVISTRYFGNEASGDLDGDGREDVAFILTRTGAGSGTFYYLAAALATDSGYRGLDTILLGDRVAPQQTEIRSGTAIANYAVRAAGEPMTAAPSVGTSTYAQVRGGKLVSVPQP